MFSKSVNLFICPTHLKNGPYKQYKPDFQNALACHPCILYNSFQAIMCFQCINAWIFVMVLFKRRNGILAGPVTSAGRF